MLTQHLGKTSPSREAALQVSHREVLLLGNVSPKPVAARGWGHSWSIVMWQQSAAGTLTGERKLVAGGGSRRRRKYMSEREGSGKPACKG